MSGGRVHGPQEMPACTCGHYKAEALSQPTRAQAWAVKWAAAPLVRLPEGECDACASCATARRKM